MLVPPLGYREFLGLVDGAHCVVTDSGGVQEETTFLGVPCFTLRSNTERPCTVDWNEPARYGSADITGARALGHAARIADDRGLGRARGGNDREPTGHDMALTEFFDSEADRFARAYDDDPKFRARAALWSELIDRHAGSARSCLDLGCGPEVQARVAAARGLATVAVDLSAAMTARIPETPDLEARIGDFMSADLRAADLVLCSSVLEYAPELERAIARVATLVADGGTLLASLPNPQSLYRRAETMAFRATGRPAYRRFVVLPSRSPRPAGDLRHMGSSVAKLIYHARFAPLLPDLFAANLAVFVLSKVSNKSTTDRATSASS